MPEDGQQIPTIGLLGGVASGKSAVAGCFERLGFAVIDADELGHQVLTQAQVIAAAEQRWGDSVIADGQIVRREVASRIFCREPECANELKFWERVTHPRIGQLIAANIEQIRDNGRHVGIILDAAVMLKGGWQKQCDFIVFIDAPEELRIKRAISRGWTTEHFRQREAAQAALAEKRRLADFVVDNSGTLEQTYEEVKRVWHSLST